MTQNVSDRSPISLAVLISGSGTTLQNFIDRIADGQLRARIVLVIASRPGIAGIERAQRAGLPVKIVERKKFDSVAAFSEEIFSLCDQASADLICLAGWLSLLKIPESAAGRVMNIHPSLLPKFGGKGMYGHHVHQAVLDHHDDISGCTVHYVDNSYDNGPVILQRTCPVLPNDTATSLAHRVFEEEKLAYPKAISLHQAGKLQIVGGRVQIRD